MRIIDLSAISLGTLLGTTTTDSSVESIIASAVGAIAVYLINLLFSKLKK